MASNFARSSGARDLSQDADIAIGIEIGKPRLAVPAALHDRITARRHAGDGGIEVVSRRH
jgi:hypothetical protein